MQPTQVQWDAWDVIMLTLPTPTREGGLVLDYLEAAALAVGKGLAETHKFVVIVVRSTVLPTTTENFLRPLLERTSGKQAGIDFGIAVNPEFLRQRSSEQDFDRPWITVLGTSDRLTSDIMHYIYSPFGSLIVDCTPTEAEMIKYVNNVYNAVKISYFNEVHQICEQLNIDSSLVGAVVARSAESMWNPLYGTRGGAPYGGACLPKDTLAFQQFCKERNWEHLLLEATIAANERLQTRSQAVDSPEQLEQALFVRS